MIEQDDIDTCIKDCENRESKMSPWEQEFIQSIREQFDRSGGLSPRQNETLEKIWEKVT
jgi:hypothetical protein